MAEALATMLAELKEDEALAEVRKVLDEGGDPLSRWRACGKALSEVGRRFEEPRNYFLSELIMSAEDLQEPSPSSSRISRRDRPTREAL